MDNLDQALYGLFRVLTLRSLDTDECAALWVSVSGQRHAPGTIRAMQILTGGSPRLLVILARFGVGLSFRDLMDDLLRLVDDHTEYFRSHLEALPAQERRVYLALADLWKPATAREIAVRARLDTSKCSAQLTRLTDRGTVEVTGGSPRRKLYYLTERLYNIYYLMRRARGPDPVVEALVRFMASYYAPVATAGQALERHGAKSPEDRWTGQLIRLMATRRCGDMAAYEREVAAILAVLPDMDGPPGEVLDALKMTSLVLGPERMREFIIASPAAGLLLPLTTALERDLGIESRVAREVKEVADDIREDFRKLKAEEANAAMGNVSPQGNGSSGCSTAMRPQP